MAASTAVPPSLIISIAIFVARGWLVAVMAFLVVASERVKKRRPAMRSPTAVEKGKAPSRAGNQDQCQYEARQLPHRTLLPESSYLHDQLGIGRVAPLVGVAPGIAEHAGVPYQVVRRCVNMAVDPTALLRLPPRRHPCPRRRR